MQQRHTIQRDLTLKAVRSLHCHATADEVYAAVARKHPRVGRGTVYRNLNQLAESGEIRKVELPEGADRFDHRRAKHYHARCLRCGKIFDVEMPYIDDAEMVKAISDAHGFAVSGYDLMFKGICSECQKNQPCDIEGGQST